MLFLRLLGTFLVWITYLVDSDPTNIIGDQKELKVDGETYVLDKNSVEPKKGDIIVYTTRTNSSDETVLEVVSVLKGGTALANETGYKYVSEINGYRATIDGVAENLNSKTYQDQYEDYMFVLVEVVKNSDDDWEFESAEPTEYDKEMLAEDDRIYVDVTNEVYYIIRGLESIKLSNEEKQELEKFITDNTTLEELYNEEGKAYEFKGKLATAGDNKYTYTISKANAQENAGQNVMNDMARYLGALYRKDNGETVSEIFYKGVSYTWNANANRAGSNWEHNGTTLVSVITADLKAKLSALVSAQGSTSDISLTLTMNGENYTYSFVLAD